MKLLGKMEMRAAAVVGTWASERSERAVRTPAGVTTRHIRIACFAIGRRRVASRSDALFV